ncbi:M20 family peptidase [Variovorax sp. VNK109]|uniref:M20 family peptidase n=1 Tax=Variovorax sp. VNK109 TaxID=3400919 RepID=UPI003BFDC8FA
MIKRVLSGLLALVVLLVVAVTVNTLRQGSRQIDVPAAPPLAVDEKAVAEKLAGAIRLQTVSSLTDPEANAAEFLKFHAYLQERFPRVHASLKRELVGGYALLYTWTGTDARAKPIALMAHHDVVPIEPGTEGKWKSSPFAGEIRDGFVWGRGAWDDKGNLIAQLEAIETLLAGGFQPKQTVYVISGADEEVSGLRGAKAIAALLKSRNVQLDFVLDEGLFIADGLMPGLTRPVAIIGIAEKGYISVVLKATGTPGHASAPPPPGNTAISRISAALRKLDEEQLPAAMKGVAREMFETMAPEMSGFQRVALSNLWLFGPIVQKQLEKSGSTNAMLRTTTALTIVQAGNKDNVIPGQAEAVVNFRIMPGETRQTVLAHVRSKVGEGIEVTEMQGAVDPTGISPTEAAPYQTLNRTMRSLFPDVLVAPALYVAGSDSHHFTGLTDNIYRFSPVRVKPEDLPRLHGTDERIATANLAELVRFYHQLLRNLNAPAS